VNEKLGEHEKKLLHRLLASGMDDERFLKWFFGQHDIERELGPAAAEGAAHYEDLLETWIEIAETHYEVYELGRAGEVREGKIKPKKRRRARKPKDIAGASERQEALAQYLERVASEDEKIISFRREFLSGRVLSAAEALIFLSSPSATARGSRTIFKMLRINPLDRILDSDYETEEGQDDSGPYRKLVWGPRRSSIIRPLGATASKLIFPGVAVTSEDLRGLRLREGRTVVFPHPREGNRFVVAEQNSVITHMASLVERALKGYPISLEMGVWFILTDEFVPEDPVRIRYMTIRRPGFGRTTISRTTFTLEVEGWTPPEEVLEQYRYVQSQVLGKTPRSPKRKALNVFEFVNRHKGKSWGELFELWNEQHPNERFKDRSHLWTSYTRTLHSHLVTPERTP
jgi:hypothetical protein